MIKEKLKSAWEWGKRQWKKVLAIIGIGIALAMTYPQAPTPIYPIEYVTAPENNTYKIGVLNYQPVLNKDISADRPLQYQLGDKYFSLKPAGVKIDGIQIKALQPTSAKINPKNYYYSGVFGEGIDLDMNFGERIWNKVIKINDLGKLGTISTKAKNIELWFELETNFVIDGWNKHDKFEITDTVRLGDYSYIKPAQVWDSYSEMNCYLDQRDNYCDEGCVDDNLCDVCDEPQEVCEIQDHRQKIVSYLTSQNGKLYYVKEIPVEWVKSAKFPIYTTADITYGTEDTFHAGTSGRINIAQLDTNKFIVCYTNNGAAGYCRVATISDTSFSWGDAVLIDSDIVIDSNYSTHGVCKLDTDKFVMAYGDDSAQDDGFARAGTVSGTTISLGSATEFQDSDSEDIDCGQLNTDKFAVIFNDETDGDDQWYIVATTSNTTINLGTSAEIIASHYYNNRVAMLNTDKIAFCYEGSSLKPYCCVGEADGSVLSFGSQSQFDTDNDAYPTLNISSLSDDYFVFSWSSAVSPYPVKVRIGSAVETTAITRGNLVSIDDAGGGGIGVHTSVAYIDSTHFVVVYADGNDSYYGKSNYSTTSGTTITLGTEETFIATDIQVSASYRGLDTGLVSTNKIVICYTDDNDSDYGKCIIGDIGAAPPPPAVEIQPMEIIIIE